MQANFNLTHRIEAAASGSNSIYFVGSAAGLEEPLQISWQNLHREALKFAALLQQKGFKPGDHVALLGLTSRYLVTAIQGIWLAGGCVIVLPIPMRMGSIGEFINQTRAHISSGDARMVLIDQGMASFYEPRESDPPLYVLQDIFTASQKLELSDFQAVNEDPDRLAILQFTSGSTSAPKGVMLPHQSICANIDAMDQMVNLDLQKDVLVSWLPLYHDMGLIGILTTSMIKGCNLVLAAP